MLRRKGQLLEILNSTSVESQTVHMNILPVAAAAGPVGSFRIQRILHSTD